MTPESISIVDIDVKRARARVVLVALAILAVALRAVPSNAEVDAKLRDALGARSPKVRIAAIAAVAAANDPQARPLLESMLADEEASVRAAAVAGLGRLEDPTSLVRLERLITDTDPTVQEVLARVIPVLRARRVGMYLGQVEDYSKRPTPAAPQLKDLTRRAIEKRLKQWVVVHDDASRAGFGAAPLAVRSVTRRKQGGNTFIDVRCELTLVEMPAKILRVALSSTASVGVEGDTDEALEEELTQEAVAACAPELADEVGKYVEAQRRTTAAR